MDAVQTQLSTVDNEDLFNSDSESDENEQERRAATFLRFGRAIPASTGSFLRFGRGIPTSSGSFLRFGRSASNFLRFGRGSQSAGTFLRFGRRTQPVLSTNFNRFARKGEFLRFG